MRHLATLSDETEAQTFVDYVLVRGVKAKVERDGDGPEGGWAVWVFDEDALPVAQEELAQFRQNPGDPKYAEVAAQAAVVRAGERKKSEAARKRQVNVRDRWNRPVWAQVPITCLVAVLAILITFWCEFGDNLQVVSLFQFSTMEHARFPFSKYEFTFSSIRHGEVWRLVTPIFIHYNHLHLVGNLYGLFVLGAMVEIRRGWKRYLVLLLCLAIFSNVAQAWYGGPKFGGLSGVVLGLFGYVWMRSRFVPADGLHIDPISVAMFLSWFFVCFTGWVGPIANAAHWGGLFLGMIIGYWPKLWRDLR